MGRKEENIDENNIIDNTPFYIETIKSIKAYLKLQSIDTPARCLQKFVELNCKKNENEDQILKNQIKMQDSTVFNDVDTFYNFSNRFKASSIYEKIHFLEEIRIIILSTLPVVKKRDREILKKYHIDIHLLQLSMSNDYAKNSQYIKFKEFLDVNFSLEKENLIGLACRGDYGTIIKTHPELEPAFETMHRLDFENKAAFSEWKERYCISDELARILTGQYKDFTNRYEEHCYLLFHNKKSAFRDSNIDILDQNYESFRKKDSWLRLIFYLATCEGSLRDIETCFESLFFQISKSNFFDSLDYLSFSRKCSFYFPYLTDNIQLNSLVVEMLISFAQKNNLKNDAILEKFANILQDQQDYEQLCRFILNHPIKNFRYSISFISFFIDNYDKFRSFTGVLLSQDDTIKFIHYMSDLSVISDEESILFLFKSDYFLFFADKIAVAISVRHDLTSKFVVKLMSLISDIEEAKCVSLSSLKAILAKKLI